MSGGRVKVLTDGDCGHVSLVITKCRPPDEGEYTLSVSNKHGSDSVEAKLLISSETALDFRAMLKKRCLYSYFFKFIYSLYNSYSKNNNK